MERVIYVGSTLQNGALTKRLFKKSFKKASSALLTIGAVVPPLIERGDEKGRLKQGEVIDVKTPKGIEADLVYTETAEKDLRDRYTPEKGWKEVSDFLE